LDTSPTPETNNVLRAVVVEPHASVRAVLEYLLVREGYAVEAGGESFPVAPGLALVLVSAPDGGGLCVFDSEDAADTLAGLIHRRALPPALGDEGHTGVSTEAFWHGRCAEGGAGSRRLRRTKKDSRQA
jgi:hypothetical protein